ncbi:MAG: Clp protease ClpP [Hydrogenoanaerobacterium sp.]
MDGVNEISISGIIVQNDDSGLYEWLGYEAVCPNDVIAALEALGGKPVTVKVDSRGGSLFAGAVLYGEFMQYSGTVTFEVVGLAASAASAMVMASAKEGSRCVISPMGMMMIHNVQSGTEGDYREMEKAAAMLKAANESAINAYCLKTGLAKAQIAEMMDAETWLAADEAVKMGFADEIMFTEDEKAKTEQSVVSKAEKASLKNAYGCAAMPAGELLAALRSLKKQGDKTEMALEKAKDEDENAAYTQKLALIALEEIRFGGK